MATRGGAKCTTAWFYPSCPAGQIVQSGSCVNPYTSTTTNATPSCQTGTTSNGTSFSLADGVKIKQGSTTYTSAYAQTITTTNNACFPNSYFCQGNYVAAASGSNYPPACSSYTTSATCTGTYGYNSSSNSYYNCTWANSQCGFGTATCNAPSAN